jgi:hypothetical protein
VVVGAAVVWAEDALLDERVVDVLGLDDVPFDERAIDARVLDNEAAVDAIVIDRAGAKADAPAPTSPGFVGEPDVVLATAAEVALALATALEVALVLVSDAEPVERPALWPPAIAVTTCPTSPA